MARLDAQVTGAAPGRSGRLGRWLSSEAGDRHWPTGPDRMGTPATPGTLSGPTRAGDARTTGWRSWLDAAGRPRPGHGRDSCRWPAARVRESTPSAECVRGVCEPARCAAEPPGSARYGLEPWRASPVPRGRARARELACAVPARRRGEAPGDRVPAAAGCGHPGRARPLRARGEACRRRGRCTSPTATSVRRERRKVDDTCLVACRLTRLAVPYACCSRRPRTGCNPVMLASDAVQGRLTSLAQADTRRRGVLRGADASRQVPDLRSGAVTVWPPRPAWDASGTTPGCLRQASAGSITGARRLPGPYNGCTAAVSRHGS